MSRRDHVRAQYPHPLSPPPPAPPVQRRALRGVMTARWRHADPDMSERTAVLLDDIATALTDKATEGALHLTVARLLHDYLETP